MDTSLSTPSAHDLEIDLEKKRLRKKLATLRNAIGAEERAGFNEALSHITLDFINQSLALQTSSVKAIIGGYYPIGSECNDRAVMAALARQGHTVALPAVKAGQKRLDFRIWNLDDDLIKDDFSIPAPGKDAETVLPDVFLVPLLGFDRKGYRLGYGKGYYDRTLGFIKSQKSILTVGLAFAIQEVDVVPFDKFDIPLDYILTPVELIKAKL